MNGLVRASVVLLMLAARVAAAAPDDAGAPLDAGAPELKLAVLDVAVSGELSPLLRRALADVAATEASRIGAARVITQGEVATLLGIERQKQLLGCTDDSGCISEVASAMDVDRVLSSEVSIIEHTTLLVVRQIDVRKGRTLGRLTATLKDASQAVLLDAMRRLTHEVLTGNKLDTTGALRLAVEQPGARITLDGADLGTSPLKDPVRRVLEGPHQLVVQKEGFVTWSSTVTVTAGGELPVVVQLVPVAAFTESARSRAWTIGYVTLGITVAAGIAGIVFGALARSSYDRYDSATTRGAALQHHDTTAGQALIANVMFAVAGAGALATAALLVTAAVSDARATPSGEVEPKP